MKTLTAEVGVKIMKWDKISPWCRELIHQAVIARERAQCPYSNFQVGAAVRTEDGDISVGQNVENVNWTATTHAEQSAVSAMITASGPGTKIDAIAIVAAPRKVVVRPSAGLMGIWGKSPKSINDVVGPCGHCRQILEENARPDGDLKVLIYLPSGEVAITTLKDLFPMSFGPEDI